MTAFTSVRVVRFGLGCVSRFAFSMLKSMLPPLDHCFGVVQCAQHRLSSSCLLFSSLNNVAAILTALNVPIMFFVNRYWFHRYWFHIDIGCIGAVGASVLFVCWFDKRFLTGHCSFPCHWRALSLFHNSAMRYYFCVTVVALLSVA